MTDKPMTSRRSFLKAGAVVAVPLAAVAAPAAAAFADDGGKARLARIEDERAIEALNRAFLRRFNAGGEAGELAEEGVTGLTLDSSAEPEHFTLSQDGKRAEARYACTAQFERELEGDGTFVQMARLQGNCPVRLSESRSFVGSYIRTAQGWAIERIALA